MDALLPKAELPRLLSRSDRDEVVLPVDEGEGAVYRAFAPATLADGLPAGLALDGGPPHRPAKEVLFPQTQALMTYDLRPGAFAAAEPPAPPTRLLFGARPCDGHGMATLDALLLQDQAREPGYQAARERTLIVAVGCRAPGAACFCTAVGGDPHGTTGVDVLATDTGAAYHLQAVSPAGEAWVAGCGLPAGSDVALEPLHEAARAAVPPLTVDVAALPGQLTGAFDDPVWETLAPHCVSCGICTYLCPTCRCFDIQDRNDPGGAAGCRYRLWDSCLFPEYTLEAGGHNPRAEPCQRWRNRFLDKFAWIPAEHGMLGCVGCGRCITECPTGVDLIALIEQVAAATGGAS